MCLSKGEVSQMLISRFVAVATEKEYCLTNILMFEIDKSKQIKFLDEMNFYYDENLKIKEYNYVKDMSFELYPNNDKYPVLVAFNFAGERYMMAFGFDGKELKRYEPVKYHSGIFNKCQSFRQNIWTVDMNGMVKRLSLKR